MIQEMKETKKTLPGRDKLSAGLLICTAIILIAGVLGAEPTRLVEKRVDGTNRAYDRALGAPSADTRVSAKSAADKRKAGLPPTSKYEANENGVRRMLQAFLEPKADFVALTGRLRPTRSDYHKFFKDDTARRIYRVYLNDWEKGRYLIKPRKGQTSLVIRKVKVKDLLKRKGLRSLPRGYNWVIPRLKKDITIYAFTFAKPGQKVGRTYAGLTFVNHHWVIFPRPWDAMFRMRKTR